MQIINIAFWQFHQCLYFNITFIWKNFDIKFSSVCPVNLSNTKLKEREKERVRERERERNKFSHITSTATTIQLLHFNFNFNFISISKSNIQQKITFKHTQTKMILRTSSKGQEDPRWWCPYKQKDTLWPLKNKQIINTRQTQDMPRNQWQFDRSIDFNCF